MNNDFEQPYGELSDTVEDVKGITDEVTSYTHSDVRYPNILVTNTESILVGYKAKTLSSILAPSSVFNQNIHVYMESEDNSIYGIGKVAPEQLRMFIDLVGIDNLVVTLKGDEGGPGRELKGKLVYTLIA